jgi:hypothetical protein
MIKSFFKIRIQWLLLSPNVMSGGKGLNSNDRM